MKYYLDYTNDCNMFPKTEWYVLWAYNAKHIYQSDAYIGEFCRKQGEKNYTVCTKSGQRLFAKSIKEAKSLIEKDAKKHGYIKLPKKLRILL
jgi:hypothetical protein